MPDNVGYTPGSGATVAADDVGGALYQRVKIAVGADGSASDATSTNPVPVAGYGELIEVLEQIRMYLGSLMGTIGSAYPDLQGRLRVTADNGANTFNVAVSSLPTLSSVTTVSTVSTISSFGINPGISSRHTHFSQMNVPALMMRNNIVVS